MTDNATIRDAVPGDGEALLSLVRDHARYEKSEASISQAQLLQVLDDSTGGMRIVVAALPDKLAGYAALTFDYALWRGTRWAHLDCLFVTSSLRGQGVGRRLLRHVRQMALRQGADRLEWQTPLWNDKAIGFYQHEGAICIPKMRFTMQLDAGVP
ncbi:GNAT family N-acetyltransferase [Novosphingobium sp. KA1]|uniref:GNAT family N-acetyltransferase n=1 Tax=Novosphingobium sp. (strain KA1) TaxID=164608 RepID=UPI001A9011A8|nr:GNAT family N-acetyltransferase [Novosphingobium sp. KA1]QSR19559.1 hypothetical protein CA833_20585 [Novosphingobium sp. KA1]